MTEPAIPPTASTTSATAVSSDHQHPHHKIDPITAVQDSIDSLALSLFEALRGVRDAVAPESLEVPGATRPTSATIPSIATTEAFKKEPDELENNASVSITDRLLNEVNKEYFPPRAFDLLEPDYDAFLLAYLGENEYAKDLVDRFGELNDNMKKKEDDGALAASKSEKKVDETIKSASDVKIEEEKKEEKPKLGEVGYEFRKKFDTVWYTGKVVENKAVSGEYVCFIVRLVYFNI